MKVSYEISHYIDYFRLTQACALVYMIEGNQIEIKSKILLCDHLKKNNMLKQIQNHEYTIAN